MTCPHGYESPASCWDCMQDQGVAPLKVNARWKTVGIPFRAIYEGRCEGCDWDIEVGQHIQRWERGDVQIYCHTRCRP